MISSHKFKINRNSFMGMKKIGPACLDTVSSSHSARVSSRKKGRGELSPPFVFGTTTFEKDLGSKMRGAHAVGAYLNHPSRSNPRGLKLKVDRAAEADSPLRALTRQSEKRRGAQQPRMS